MTNYQLINSRIRRKASLFLLASCLYQIGWTTYAMIYTFTFRLPGDGKMLGAATFRYFTNDSNILNALSCLLMLPSLIRCLKKPGPVFREALLLLRYIAVSALTLTFLTVVFFLCPIYGYQNMFSGVDLYLHLAGPLLSMVSFLFPERLILSSSVQPPRRQNPPAKKEVQTTKQHDGKREYRLPWLAVLFSMIPMLIYAVFYIRNVVILGPEKGGWPDFYALNTNGSWPYSLAIMTGAVFAIGFILRLFYNHQFRRTL
ncbi:MAG: hypothetical protein IKE58_04910 [Blautia sp.]|nr:hypothetical protein [Blautia sp.]